MRPESSGTSEAWIHQGGRLTSAPPVTSEARYGRASGHREGHVCIPDCSLPWGCFRHDDDACTTMTTPIVCMCISLFSCHGIDQKLKLIFYYFEGSCLYTWCFRASICRCYRWLNMDFNFEYRSSTVNRRQAIYKISDCGARNGTSEGWGTVR
jgi:hypothetical protein